jgi:hypothetical protein
MFPFRFDYIAEGETVEDRHEFYKNKGFDERIAIEKMVSRLCDDGWQYRQFQIVEESDYNEYAYFHDFVRDAIFNFNDKENIQGSTSFYFEKPVAEEGAFYRIDVSIDGNEHSYELKLTNLSLRIFDTGVGILSVEVENHRYPEFKAVLRINEYGRRVYPQFLGREGPEDSWTAKTKEAFLPERLVVSPGSGEVFEERFDYREIPRKVMISDVVMKLLGDATFMDDSEKTQKYLIRGDATFTDDSGNPQKYLIRPIIDDRMFVVCWYGNNDFSSRCVHKCYRDNDDWYRFVFLDGKEKTIANMEMQRALIEKATYDRWSGHGTLYGVTRYSFVALTNRNDFATNVLRKHVQTIYYQMFTLLLAQRASILRFSDEIAALSDIEERKESELSKKASKLYKNYIRFVNKLYFREVSPEDQGIELYDKARDVMRIDKDIKDLDEEIAELHSYVQMLEDHIQSEKMNQLSQFGFMLLPPTFFAGFFGMNVFGEWFNGKIVWPFFLSLSLIVISTIAGYFFQKQNRKK